MFAGGIFGRLPIFQPALSGGGGPTTMVVAVRNNSPWHRKSFTPCYFPFRMNKRLQKPSVEHRVLTPAGRQILMRRVLMENHFIAWNWPSKKSDWSRLEYPLASC